LSRHVVLNSEARGNGSKVIDGAYSDSQLLSLNMKQSWNEMLEKDVLLTGNSKNSKEEDGEHMTTEMFKKVCELSHDNIRSKIYEELVKVQPVNEYYDSWIWDVYEDNFILYLGESNYVRVSYTKTETEVTIDYANREVVVRDWVAVQAQIEEFTVSMNALKEEKEALEIAKNEIETAKSELEVSYNEATEKLVALNSKVEEYAELEKSINAEKLEKAINERKEHFELKFKAVNGIEKFESEEVQELIVKSVEDNEALLSLNSMIVEMISVPVVEVETETKDNGIKVLNSKTIGNLIPKSNSFEDKYITE